MSDWLKSGNTLVSVSMVWHTKLEINDVVRIHVVIEFLIHSLDNIIGLVLSSHRLLVHRYLKMVFKVPGHDNEHRWSPLCCHDLKDIVIQSSQDSLNFDRLIEVDSKLFKLLKPTLINPWVFQLVTAIHYSNVADHYSSNEVVFYFLLNGMDLVLDQLNRRVVLKILW